MKQSIFNWRSLVLLLAMTIVALTVVYTRYLGRKIEREESQRVVEWVLSNKVLQTTEESNAITLANTINFHNEDIPLIATDETGLIVDYRNLDTAKAQEDTGYIRKQLTKLQKGNPPIDWPISDSPRITYKVYYGNTPLLNEVRYYPWIQLLLVAMFFVLTFSLLQVRNRSTQNQLWAGMAKETAHQLGTPLTSMEGWLALLKENPGDATVVMELESDLERLIRVSDRFGKIGSTPKLEKTNLCHTLRNTETYIKARASEKVLIALSCPFPYAEAMLSPTLFEWVMENLLKNALDAIEGAGSIAITLSEKPNDWIIEVKDTGKGISRDHFQQIFNPGFTTKKRGWGLGLSLSKRIISQYHHGKIYVAQSETGIGTTFRIELPK